MKTISMALGVSRSNLVDRLTSARAERKPRYNKLKDLEILPDIRAICAEKPSYGYRRVTALLNRKYRAINVPLLNHKRVYRLMRQNQLLLQKYTGRPTRTHDGKVVTLKSNLRWCSDTFNIRCFNGEKVEVAFSLDTCDREVISYVATESATTGEMIRDLMAQSLEARFASLSKLPHPIEWLSDNGHPYIAHETRSFGAEPDGSPIYAACIIPIYTRKHGASEACETFNGEYGFLVARYFPHGYCTMHGWFNDYKKTPTRRNNRYAEFIRVDYPLAIAMHSQAAILSLSICS